VDCFGQAGIYAGVSGVFALSRYHASMLPKAVHSKVVVTRNGLDPVAFVDGPNHPNHFIYASDPARGLKVVLLNWKAIRTRVPDAQLAVYYGFSSMSNVTEKEDMEVLLKQPGVVYHGMVGHDELAVAFAQAGAMIYPTSFPEISCINAMKAQANGCFPISSRFAALKETSRYDAGPVEPPQGGHAEGDTAWQARWVDAIAKAAEPTPENTAKRKEMKAWARQQFEWRGVAKQWHGLFNKALNSVRERKQDPEMEELRRMLEVDPACSGCYNRIGILHDRHSRTTDALAAYAQAIVVNPYEGQAYTNIGFTHMRVGMMREAIAWYAKATVVQPNQVEAYINLGAAHKDLDDLDTAVWALSRALRLRLASSDVYYNIAQIHDQRGDHGTAMKEFAASLKWFEVELRNYSSPAHCPQAPGHSPQCISEVCSAGQWRLLHSGGCGEAGILCHHLLPAMQRPLYGFPHGPRWAGDPSGREVPPGHVVASGGALWGSLLFREKEAWVAEISGALIAGKSGTITSACRVVLPVHSSFIPVHRDVTQAQPAPSMTTLHFRQLVSIIQMSDSSYYHFILEGIPRLALLISKLRPVGTTGPKVLIPSLRAAPPFLRLLGIERTHVFQPLSEQYYAATLITADWRSVDPRPATRFFAPRHALRLARSLFLDSVQPRTPGTPPFLVYVSRRDAHYRRVSNEQEILTRLKKVAQANNAELRVFVGNETSASATVRLFSGAAMVVGPHGGGLSNVLFCQDGASLVEFALPEPTMRFYAHAAVALSLDYWVVTAPPDSFRKDFEINADEVEQVATQAWPKVWPSR